MSFGEKSTSIPVKNFISKDEIEENRRVRQEEWEKVRRPDQPLECPEVTENRSLYEQLEEQKQKQQDEYEEKHKFQSTVKGLDESDSNFLDYVANKQIEINQEKKKEMGEIMKELEDASVIKVAENSTKTDAKKTTKTQPSTSNKSQQSLLAGAVKRKSSDNHDEVKKKRLSSAGEEKAGNQESADTSSLETSSSEDLLTAISSYRTYPQYAQSIGVLPSLVCYNDVSSDSVSSSNEDSDEELTVQPKT